MRKWILMLMLCLMVTVAVIGCADIVARLDNIDTKLEERDIGPDTLRTGSELAERYGPLIPGAAGTAVMLSGWIAGALATAWEEWRKRKAQAEHDSDASAAQKAADKVIGSLTAGIEDALIKLPEEEAKKLIEYLVSRQAKAGTTAEVNRIRNGG